LTSASHHLSLLVSIAVIGFAGRGKKLPFNRHSARLPLRGAFFLRQSDKLVDERVCCRVISANQMAKTVISTGRRNTLSFGEKIDYRPISHGFRGGTRAADQITL
jgi:hypothetical protein